MLLVPPPSPPLFPAANLTPKRHLRPCIPTRRLLASPVAVVSNEVGAFTRYSGCLFQLSSAEAESLTEYSISRIKTIYQRKPLILLRRLFQTATTLGKRVSDRADLMLEAYIKVAQAISSRSDLIPPSFLDELSLLQDRITPFCTEVAFETIEQERGLPIDALFSEISPDVSKEDKQEQPSSLEENEVEPENIVDKRRLEEKFAVVNTGIHECRSCGYKYDQATGDPLYPIPPGLPFDKLPDDWRCPTCGASQSFFESKSMEIAGFAQNQQYGLGGNTLTSGQKALLIYGSLLLGFALFLSGYFLQ